MQVGILALQGGFALHEQKLDELGVGTIRISRSDSLKEVDGLIIPGGESSTMLKNMDGDLWTALTSLSPNFPVWGTCAGTVLLATEVSNPAQNSLDLIDISVERNSYGSQNDSFIAPIDFNFTGGFTSDCVFIRAPRITRVGKSCTVLARYNGDAVMVEEGNWLATTFHPELSESEKVHSYFIDKIESGIEN